jgi:hypothetical protein
MHDLSLAKLRMFFSSEEPTDAGLARLATYFLHCEKVGKTLGQNALSRGLPGK